MGVGLTSLGHLWAGRRRPHNNYVIGNPADTTPIVHSAEHYAARAAGQRPQGGPQWSCSGATIPGPAGRRPNRDCGPQGGAAEELLGNYAISARRPQTSMGELRAKCGPRRSCLVLRDSASPTADLLKGRVFWWSCGSYVPEQAPQGAMGCGIGWSRGSTGRRSSMTSEADHVGGTVTSDY